jgi:RNA polymerase sigma factor (sigma-70 family)
VTGEQHHLAARHQSRWWRASSMTGSTAPNDDNFVEKLSPRRETAGKRLVTNEARKRRAKRARIRPRVDPNGTPDPIVNPSHVVSDSLPSEEIRSVDSLAAEMQSHQPSLKSWLRSRFPWLGEVDDIAQEAVFRLWRRQSREDSTPLKSCKAALFTIARNAVVDLARHRAVAKTDCVAEMGHLSVLDEGANVIQIVNARQELEFLADALRGLPDRCRQVVTLAKIYGLSEREVAERLGISENTVRTHVVRGMERCTDYLRARGINRSK